ncbi:MAG: NEL-type E3 ubiquitin ligase domain-containing protein [Pseudomonadota bacterium]
MPITPNLLGVNINNPSSEATVSAPSTPRHAVAHMVSSQSSPIRQRLSTPLQGLQGLPRVGSSRPSHNESFVQQNMVGHIAGASSPTLPEPISELAFHTALAAWVDSSSTSERLGRQTAAERIVLTRQNNSQELDLHGLHLTSLPNCMLNLTSVQTLHLSDNMLGSLPALPPSVRNLDVGNNRLTHHTAFPPTLNLLHVEGNHIPHYLPLRDATRLAIQRHAHHAASISTDGETSVARFNRVVASARRPANQMPLSPAECAAALDLVAHALAGMEEAQSQADIGRDRRNGLDHQNYSPARRNLNNHPEFWVAETDTTAALPFTTHDAMFNLSEPHSYLLPNSSTGSSIDPTFSDLSNGVSNSPGAIANMTQYGVVQVETIQQAFKAIKWWEPEALASEPDVDEKWASIAREPNALEFAGVLSNLESTEAYRNPVTRPRLEAQIDELMTEVFRSPEFRTSCFSAALTGSDSCHDRIALAFTDMSFALINYKADKGEYSLPTLLKMGRGLFRSRALDKIALENIENQRLLDQQAAAAGEVDAPAEVSDPTGVEEFPEDEDEGIDEVEVRLAYQSRLAEKLDLPAVAHDMRYFESAHVSSEELDDAERSIREQEHGGADLRFLTDWKPWQTAMQKRYPEVFEALKVKTEQDREWLVFQPEAMTSGQYMAACAVQQTQEAAAFTKLMIEQTKLSMVDLSRAEA